MYVIPFFPDAHFCDEDTWTQLNEMIGMSVHCSVLTTVTNRTALTVRADENNDMDHGTMIDEDNSNEDKKINKTNENSNKQNDNDDNNHNNRFVY